MLRGEKLGEGTFGIVYGATSPTSGKRIALKRNLVEDDTCFIGTPREVDVLNRLRGHPHIVNLEKIIFGEPFTGAAFSPLVGKERKSQRNDSMHFAFEAAEYDLHTFVYGAVTIDYSLIQRYMTHILLGMEALHGKRLVHRDMKPSNILIFGKIRDALGIGNVAQICDFGLTKPYTYQGDQTPCTVTSWYRAPEIALGYPHYDYKADMWSVGCILFEMIAKRSFISESRDNNDEIISEILGTMPEELPVRKLRELVRSNKWRTVKLTKAHSPRVRKNFEQLLGLTPAGKDQFEKQAGSFTAFCDLLGHLLKFEWEPRFTATQALDHPFFDRYRPVIEATRAKYPIGLPAEQPITVRTCMERKWMADAATDIFNNRTTLKWYSHRKLLQAMDLFDRYLDAMFKAGRAAPNAVESDLKGLINDKFTAELRFMTCVYLCVKYFNSIHHPVTFQSIVSANYSTPQALHAAEQFEGSFIQNCLQYQIYRPTMYEAADAFGDKLGDVEVRDLIVLYSKNASFSGLTHSELYHYYRTHLRGKAFDRLFDPVVSVPMAPPSVSVPVPESRPGAKKQKSAIPGDSAVVTGLIRGVKPVEVKL